MNTIQHSESIKTGLREGFQDGTSKLVQRKCCGYEMSADGELVIKKKEAMVVRWIFEQFAESKSLGKIADGLARQGIPSPTGKPKWNRETAETTRARRADTSTAVRMKRSSSDDLFRTVQEERLRKRSGET